MAAERKKHPWEFAQFEGQFQMIHFQISFSNQFQSFKFQPKWIHPKSKIIFNQLQSISESRKGEIKSFEVSIDFRTVYNNLWLTFFGIDRSLIQIRSKWFGFCLRNLTTKLDLICVHSVFFWRNPADRIEMIETFNKTTTNSILWFIYLQWELTLFRNSK